MARRATIRLVVLTEGEIHAAVLHTYAQRAPDQFDKWWKKQVFTGKGAMPAQAKTDAEVVDYVAKTPGAFGYVAKSSAATDRVHISPCRRRPVEAGAF